MTLVKPLAKRTRKSTQVTAQVFDLCSTYVSFGHPFALMYVEFGRTQVNASFSPFGH